MTDKQQEQFRLFQNLIQAAVDYVNSLEEGERGCLQLIAVLPDSDDDKISPVSVGGGDIGVSKDALSYAMQIMPQIYSIVSDAIFLYQSRNGIFSEQQLN